jgi:hypothetical protein
VPGAPDGGGDAGTVDTGAVPDAAIAEAEASTEAAVLADAEAGSPDDAETPDSAGEAAADAGDGSVTDAAADAADAAEAGPSPATFVSVGILNTCAATASGNALCWTGTAAPAPLPPLTGGVATVSAAGWGLGYSGEGYFDCEVTTAGAVWCLGENANGELGNGSTVNSTVPTPVTTLTSGVTALSAGIGSTAGSGCAVTGGNVWCWGYNGNGQLGNGTTAGSSAVPVELAGFTGSVTAVSMGLDSACAIASGSVMCWGTNANGELGNNSVTGSLAPVQVMGITSGATAVSVGDNYACAIVSGGAQCWGTNGFGQSLVPAPVTGLASGVTDVSVGAAPTSITGAGAATGGDSACAVVGGAVQCWGNNGNGQLGNNSVTSSAMPVPVASLTSGVAAVSVGYGVACALTSGGGVWCWGNGIGRVPVRVPGFPQ